MQHGDAHILRFEVSDPERGWRTVLSHRAVNKHRPWEKDEDRRTDIRRVRQPAPRRGTRSPHTFGRAPRAAHEPLLFRTRRPGDGLRPSIGLRMASGAARP